jgi:hypothetical protein
MNNCTVGIHQQVINGNTGSFVNLFHNAVKISCGF